MRRVARTARPLPPPCLRDPGARGGALWGQARRSITLETRGEESEGDNRGELKTFNDAARSDPSPKVRGLNLGETLAPATSKPTGGPARGSSPPPSRRSTAPAGRGRGGLGHDRAALSGGWKKKEPKPLTGHVTLVPSGVRSILSHRSHPRIHLNKIQASEG